MEPERAAEDKKFIEDAKKIAEDTAIQIECKIRPMNAAELIEPLHKDRSYNDDLRKLEAGIVEMKKTDPAKHNLDYPQETFKFTNV
jgi:hypothetical protein